MLIANADDFGRLAGDAWTVKHAVFPSSPRKESEFYAALTSMHHVGLIHHYEANGCEVIQVLDFKEHQPGLNQKTASKFPEPPAFSVKVPESPSELIRTELIRTEGNGTALTRSEDGESGFNAFWLAYPKKKSRATAAKVWRKLAPSPELLQRILDAVAAQRNSASWLRDGGQYIPHPATWLNGQRWEDEPDPVRPAVTAHTQQLAIATAEFLSHDDSDREAN